MKLNPLLLFFVALVPGLLIAAAVSVFLFCCGVLYVCYAVIKETTAAKKKAQGTSDTFCEMNKRKNEVLYLIDTARTYEGICAADDAVDDFINRFYNECEEIVIIKMQQRFEKRQALVRKWDKKKNREQAERLVVALRYTEE